MNPDYTIISAIKSDYDGTYCLLVMKDGKRFNDRDIRFHYSLVRRFIGKDHAKRMYASETADISLDGVRGFREQPPLPGFPTWITPFTKLSNGSFAFDRQYQK